MTEQELVSRARAGDQDAFEQLVLANQNKVYTLTFRMVNDREEAEDLAQEAFLKAWQGLPSFQGDSSFSTWVYRLTSNACLDFLRSKKRRQEHMGQAFSLDDEDAPSLPDEEQLQPQQQLEKKERARQLYRALEQLSDQHRQIIVMRELSGLSYQEISEALQLDIGTVKSRLTRARLSLKKILLETGVISPCD